MQYLLTNNLGVVEVEVDSLEFETSNIDEEKEEEAEEGEEGEEGEEEKVLEEGDGEDTTNGESTL